MPIQWLAHYADGSTLPQYDADGCENQYASIDRSRLEGFSLWDDGKCLVHLALEPGQRLVYRRRVETSPTAEPIVIYLAGWQQTVQGTNVQSIFYVLPNGTIVSAGRFTENHRFFYPIVPVPCEVGS